MKGKKFIGLIVLVIGIAVIGFSVYNMKRVANAKGTIDTLTSPFVGKTGGQEVHGFLTGQASQYDSQLKWLLVGGIVLAVIGGGTMLCCCKKKKR